MERVNKNNRGKGVEGKEHPGCSQLAESTVPRRAPFPGPSSPGQKTVGRYWKVAGASPPGNDSAASLPVQRPSDSPTRRPASGRAAGSRSPGEKGLLAGGRGKCLIPPTTGASCPKAPALLDPAAS